MAGYNADIAVRVSGLDKLKLLEKQLEKLNEQRDRLSRSVQRVSDPFKDQVESLRRYNRLIRDNTKALQDQVKVASAAARAGSVGGSRGGGPRGSSVRPADVRLEQERTAELQRQVGLLKERARAAGMNQLAMNKLTQAEYALARAAEGNQKYGQELIRNARTLITEQERRAASAEKAAARELRAREQLWKAEERAAAQREREAERLWKARRRAASAGLSAVGQAVTGGGGLRGGLIRGGLAAGAAGLGYAASTAISGVAASQLAQQQALLGMSQSRFALGPIKDALEGMAGAIPQVNPQLAELAQTIQSVTGNAGLAAAAFAAFAPLLPSLGKAAFNAGAGFRKFVSDVGTVEMPLKATNLQLEILQKNLAASQRARAGSGFAGFSSSIEDLLGTQKAQRRNLERRMRGYESPGIQPTLALPSAEMLNASQRGLRQLIQSEEALAAATAKTARNEELVAQGIDRRAKKLRDLQTYQDSKVRSTYSTAPAPLVSDVARGYVDRSRSEELPIGGSGVAAVATAAAMNGVRMLSGAIKDLAKADAVLEATDNAVGEITNQLIAARKEVKLLEVELTRKGGIGVESLKTEIATRKENIALLREERKGLVDRNATALAAKDRLSAAERRKNLGEGLRAGIGSGLATANIPGQSIAQAAVAGSLLSPEGSKAIGAITGAATGGLVALTAYGVAATKTAANLAGLETRLRALSVGFDDYGQVLRTAQSSGQLFNQTQEEALTGFSAAYARLRPLGLTLEQVRGVYEGFNVAARLSGTTTAEAAGAFTQLTQALGSGALRGAELNSILEQAPALAQAIASAMGTTVGQLKKLGEDGKISSEKVLQALINVRNEGVGRLSQSMNTPEQQFKRITIAGENMKRTLGDKLLPQVTRAVEELATLLQNLGPVLQGLGSIAASTLGTINDLVMAATKPKEFAAASSIRSGRLPQFLLGGRDGAEQLFLGSSGAFGTGLTGLMKEAKELARHRKQPVDQVLLELMQNRLTRLDAANKPAIPQLTTNPTLSGALAGVSGAGSSSGGSDQKFQPSSRARALMAAAQKLGISPLDLATIISFETAGTFSPSIRGGAGGNYQGLIQFGPTERQKYGVTPGQSFEEQVMGPVVRYFEDRFKGVGMTTKGADLLTLYRTVLGGNPKANINAKDAFGTSAASGVGAMGPHRNKALAMFFGGDLANVGYDAADAAENLAAGWDEIYERIQGSFEEGRKLTTELQRQLDGLNAVDDAAREQLRIQFEWQDRQEKINELLDEKQKKDLTALNSKIKEIEQLKLQTEELEKQREIIDEMQGGGYKNFSGGNIDTYTDAGQAIAESKKQLEDLTNPINQVVAGATAIGEAFGESFRGLVSGAMTAQQALANFFQKTADHFLDMAAQIAAAAIKHAIISTIFRGATGAITGGAFGGGGIDWGQTPSVGGVPDLPGLTPFATGGLVTRPTPALLGEGGEPEVVLPQSKIGAAMRNYRPGSGAAGLAQAMNAPEGGGGGGVTVNYTGPTLNFNGDDYLPKSAVPEIIATAAKRGSEGGHARVMGDFRNKRSTRARLGL